MNEKSISQNIFEQSGSLFVKDDVSEPFDRLAQKKSNKKSKKFKKKQYSHQANQKRLEALKARQARPKHLSKTYQCKKTIRNAAIKLLAKREHSQFEIMQKLERYYHGEIIDDVLLDLIEQDWQSDKRFARMWTRSRANRGYGPSRIKNELMQKCVAHPLIQDALAYQNLEEKSWISLAEEVYQKKFGDGDVTCWKDKAKRLSFMQYRGFTGSDFESLL